MERILYSDPHVTISIDDEAGIVRYARSGERYESLEALRALNKKIRDTFALLPSGTLALLIDIREAPARNDDAFEGEIISALQALAGRFTAQASLVKSAVGRLQAQRIARARTAGAFQVFSDEAEALAYLRR